MTIQKCSYLLSSCLLAGLILAGCSSDTPSPQSSNQIFGTYLLKHVDCDGEASSIYSDDFLKSKLLVKVVYAGDKAERISSYLGCVQHVPVTSIQYLENSVLEMTEGEAFCDQSTIDSCMPIEMCKSKVVTQKFKHDFVSDNHLRVEIPPSPEQLPPCEPEQTSNKVIFEYEKIE